MPNSTQEEKLRWIKPILDGEISIKMMSKVCPFSERSLKYWIKNYQELGFDGLRNESARPKSQPNETPIRIKERVIELRMETKLSALKLHYKLNKEGIRIHPRTIGKILKREDLTRKYRLRKPAAPKPKADFLPGELIEIDVKWVPERIEGGRYFQFTAIDCGSRWRYLEAFDDISNASALKFLNNLIKVFPYQVRAIKTDNGSCFTNRYTGYEKSTDPLNPKLHALDLLCQKKNIIHYLIDPGKPAQNGKVERSHRTDQEHFYDEVKFKSFEDLKLRLKLWNMYYNDLEHIALNGLTPNEVLRGVQKVRT